MDQRHRHLAVVSGVVFVLVVMGSACVGGETRRTTTPAASTQAPPPAPGSSPTEFPVAAPPSSPAASGATSSEPSPPPATSPISTVWSPPVMPDVVCLDLQAAQERINEVGVFLSRSVDATGAGRLQLIDRHWIVVAQHPVPGATFGEADAVLEVVKQGEANPC